MKLLIIITFAFISLMSASCATTNAPAGSETFPFYSVVVRDGAIIATLPDSPSWIVRYDIDERHQTKPQESFTLKDGSSLNLIEQHLSYEATAQLAPTPGLKMEYQFDARSFGGAITNRIYFIPAK